MSRERESLESAGWGLVSDRLMRGVAHGVNGRAAALASWVDLSEGDSVENDCLEPEIEKLTELGRMVAAIPLGLDVDAEPVVLADVLETSLPLHGLHRGLESVAVVLERSGSPVVRAPIRRLTQVLVLLLGDVGWRADQAKARRVLADVDDAGLLLRHSEAGERRMEPLEPRPIPERPTILGALGPLLETWGLRATEREDGALVVEKTD